MEISKNGLISFASACMKACKASRIRLFSSRFSKRTYTQRQHVTMLLIMKKLRLRYRNATELLEVVPDVRKVIGLDRIPHYTTLQKFFRRFGGWMLTLLLAKAAELSGMSGTIAIDSTGFSSSSASRHYSMIKYRYEKGVWSGSYVKANASVDTESGAVVCLRMRKDHRHDSVDFRPLLSRTSKLCRVNVVVADKGYDFEELHRFVRDDVGAVSVIPVRKRGKVWGRYRKMMDDNFDRSVYNRRSVAECVFSIVKRRFGDTVYSRSWKLQKKELKLMFAAHNVQRYVMKCVIISVEDFYRTE